MMCSLELRPFCTIPVQVYIRGFNSYAPLICICSILNSSILNCSFPYILSDLPQRKLISKEFSIIFFSVLNNLAFAATEYHFTLMDALKYLNTVFAHYFIVFMGKIKLMISRSDATAWYRNLENRNWRKKKTKVFLKLPSCDIISAVYLCNRNCYTSPSIQQLIQ